MEEYKEVTANSQSGKMEEEDLMVELSVGSELGDDRDPLSSIPIAYAAGAAQAAQNRGNWKIPVVCAAICALITFALIIGIVHAAQR